MRHGELPAALLAAVSSPHLCLLPSDLRRPAAPRCATEERARSYLADGTGVVWRVDRTPLTSSPSGQGPRAWRIAVDAEAADGDLPPYVRSRSLLDPGVTGEQALASWTRAEVMAKLTDTPILLRIKEFGLTFDDVEDVGPIALHTLEWDDLLVTVGAMLARPCA